MLHTPDALSSGAVLPAMNMHRSTDFSLRIRRHCRHGMIGLGLPVWHPFFQRSLTARIKCSAAAMSVPLHAFDSVTSDNLSNSSHKPATTASSPTSSNSCKPDAPSVNSTAAAVAAKFPAVPNLPTPPGSGNLRDVVPYLLRLALQERHLAWRLAAAVSCMVVTKLAGISLPLAFKGAVDAMSAAGPPAAMAQAALMAVLTYGALDCVRVMAKEAQSPIFAPVSQAVTRRVAYHTFAHVLNLDTKFHVDRRTGRVSRILERGTRSIAVLYRAMIFTFLPTGLELGAVAALLASRFGPLLAAILSVTFAAYVTWTVYMTQRATDVRKEVNHFDNQASSKAVDALLNFETVTLFNNQRLEVGLYDKLLRDLRSASLRAETLAAALNSGQGLILAVGMASILAAIIASGNATGGDLVMGSGLIVQLWAPLQFLGWFYRELRAALVDMEEFFQILRTPSNIRDGELPLPLTATTSSASTPASASASSSASVGLEGERQDSGNSTPRTTTCHGGPTVDDVRPTGQSAPGGLSVEFVDVSFGYSPERQILRGVSLRVAPGESVAVVGSSGSGKSTMLKLITRLYDVWPDVYESPSDNAKEGDESYEANGTGSGNGDIRTRAPDSSNLSNRTITCSGSSGSSSSLHKGHGSCALNASDVQAGAFAENLRQEQDMAAPTSSTSTSSNSGSSSGYSSSNSCGSSSSTRSSGRRPSGVYINGVDVRQLRLADLRSAIAVVPQDTALYYDTVRENIRYGRPEASDEEVEAAARMARLHDTVTTLSDKYDTVVGERGLKLSGGEKQRVAIARAFLRSPRLLICDEATSALDSGTEVAIMDSLKELARGRSALFVAHRLSTVRNCDRIVVLRSGVVVEEGSHDQLMAKRGEYAAMWELQAHQQATDLATREGDGGITDSDVDMSDAEDEELEDQDAEPAAAAAAAVRRRDAADRLDGIGSGSADSGFVSHPATSVRAAAVAAPTASSATGAEASAATAAVRSAITHHGF